MPPAQPTAPPLVIEVPDGEAPVRIVVTGNLCVAHWRNAPTLKQIQALVVELRRMAARHGPQASCFANVVHGGRPDFRNDVRDAIVKATVDPASAQGGTAQVVLVGGLVGAATRAFLGTVTLLSRTGPPTRVFGDVGGAARWLGERLAAGPVAWTQAELVTALTA